MKLTAHKRHLATHELTHINFALLITSDSRTPKTDLTGKAIIKLMKEHHCLHQEIIKNDLSLIRNKIKSLLGDKRIQMIITSGGTGCGRKDVSIEAALPLASRRLEGFGELFRMLSYQEIGSSAIMSRAMLGVAGNGQIIVALPGSPNAVKLALTKLLLPELAHLLWEIKRN